MDSLTFLFTTVSVIGLMFLLWLYTKPLYQRRSSSSDELRFESSLQIASLR